MPLALWLHALPPGVEGRLAAMRGSAVFGAVYFVLVFHWLVVALLWFTKLAILAFLLTVAVLVALSALLGWAMHHALHGARAPLWVALPVLWTALEWTRAHLPDTLAFPWLGLGTSLTAFPELVGMAELVGARGVTFWLALCSALLAGVLVRLRDGTSWVRDGALLAAVVLAPAGWGVWRASTLELYDAGRVAVVQPNVPEHVKLDVEPGIDSTFASLDRLVPGIEPGSVDLVVLPEATLLTYPELPRNAARLQRLQGYSREVGAPLLFGALGLSERPGEPGWTRYNSAFLMTPQGAADFRYDKRHLVPFVERVPLLPPEWFSGRRYFEGYGVGTGWPLAEAGGAAYGVLICYESAYPEAARAFRRAGADVLVNVTNDAWFGRVAPHTRTSALWQHPAHLVMRAIENRVGVARSANTGISLFVDPIGRVHDPTRLFEPDVRVRVAQTTAVTTLYTRTGDVVGNGSAMAALLLVLVGAARARRRAG